MLKHPSLENRANTRLPSDFFDAHELCFAVHDVMTQLLVSGMRASAFHVTFALNDPAARAALENSDDILDWVSRYRTQEERSAVLVTTVFPAVLSDMLHCFYEALETSRKGKLTIAYMLLRNYDRDRIEPLIVPLDRVAGKTRHMPDVFFVGSNTISDEGRRYFRRLLPKRPDIFLPFV
jgi:hypothetical protein